MFIFQNSATAVLVGFGFGASLIALFMRVGGGIFTKAADVGADLVGKVEAGIPEDDPRNAATIADNVGDNVGDCAGMAADLFESYEITIIASLILGYSAFKSLHLPPARGLLFPLIVAGIGILTSAFGILIVRARDRRQVGDGPDQPRLSGRRRAHPHRGVPRRAVLRPQPEGLLGRAHRRRPGERGEPDHRALHLDRAEPGAARSPTRPAPARRRRCWPASRSASSRASGRSSPSSWPIASAVALGGGKLTVSLYLVALVGIGMLSTTGMIISEDSFGPVSDNAAGIAEMSGEFTGEAERVMVSLDAVGNTTKAITKGVAIGSAVIAAVALFSSFIETIGNQLPQLKHVTGDALFHNPLTQINVAVPTTFIGLLIGGSIAFLFSSLAIRAVGRSAGTVVHEVRRQFREHPGIMDYTEKPEYGRVISICTAASQRELATPALLAVLSPVIVGFGINYIALGAFLTGTILTGQLMANFLSNSGGAWDNAKKYIEDGHLGGKGSEAHKAAVIGDTVGDPFKDTAGPALNPLIKVMNLVSLLILPAVITLRHHDGARFADRGGRPRDPAGLHRLLEALD